MIDIQLVRVGDRLMGRRFQDRRNLQMLGVNYGVAYDRNHSSVKKMRRLLAKFGGFTVTVITHDPIIGMTNEDMGAFDVDYRCVA